MSRIYRAFLANERGLRRLFARYFPRAEDIEELVQETFVKCFAAEMKTRIHDPKFFLFRAAKNLAISERRKKFWTTTDYIEDSGGSDVFMDERELSAEARLDGKRKLAVLAKALASLPPDVRRAFLMRRMEGLGMTQIATRLNVSVKTVHNRIASALAQCDAYLCAQGYDPMEFGGLASPGKRPAKVDAAIALAAVCRQTSDADDGE